MRRCKYCGDKLPDTSRCCYKCGNLNPYNKENVESGYDNLHDVEKLDLTNDKEKENKKYTFPLSIKLSTAFDIFAILFVIFLFSPLWDFDTYLKLLPLMLVIGFYRLTVLRCLLYKSGMAWWGVYIPFYGLWLYYEMGMLQPEIIIPTFFVILFALYSSVVAMLGGTPIVFIVLCIIACIYLLRIHIKTCDGYAFRFRKNKRFKILLILFWPILIVYLAFNKDDGRINMEEDSSTKV